MLAGAVRDYLAAEGLSPVHVGGFGDYREATAWNVHVESDADAELDGETYEARLQLRARARDIVRAEQACEQAFELARAADGSELEWQDPTGGASRRYVIEALRVMTRPTWYPTPEPGEEASCNLRLMVTRTL